MAKAVAALDVEPKAGMLVVVFVPFWKRTCAIEPIAALFAAAREQCIRHLCNQIDTGDIR